MGQQEVVEMSSFERLALLAVSVAVVVVIVIAVSAFFEHVHAALAPLGQ